ncbi:LysE family translocator [uncultured Cocleimonas sp.]|uniref:LysE family translocator n=1 Tax=uncultured Cocleimonas sp. TaxID=1051587 RepID=UPI00262CFE77|nr:LysE family translocator [uncultured Cocleimonas sp.]
MGISSWLLFIAVAIAAVASPGPAILLAISNSIRFGLSKVLLSSLGNISGLFLLSLAAIFGLGAIIKTSTTLFLIVKVIGAGYLIYLGVKQWRTKSNFFDEATLQSSFEKRKSAKRHYLEGFFIAMTNPKAILFFTALFPQFLNTQESLSIQFFIMTLTLMAMSFIALMTYGLLASKAKRWFAEGERTKWFNRVLGSVFISIGIGVLQLKIER